MGRPIANLVLNTFTNDSRVLKTSKALQADGFDVEVVAYHDAGLAEREEVEGIPVRRLRLATRRLPRNIVTRVLTYLEFIARGTPHAWRAGTLHCNDLGTIIPGVLWRVASLGRLRLVYDSHEYAINDQPGEGRAMIFLKWIAERLCIRHADAVICVSGSIADAYARMYRIPRPSLVLNCPPRTRTTGPSDLLRTSLGLRNDQRIFLYQGALARGRGIEIMLGAFERREADCDVAVFMGYGPMEADIRAVAARCPRVRFQPAAPVHDVLRWTASADYGVCLIEDACLSFRYCLPNKLFEYLAAGLPVLASGLPELRSVIESRQVGVVTAHATPEALNTAIDELLSRPRAGLAANARSAAEEFCWENQIPVLLGIHRRVAGRG